MKNQFFFRRPFKYSFFNASLILVAINCLFFIFTYFAPMYVYYLALNVGTLLLKKMYWQPITYMFIHGGLWHLFFNMLMLLQIGTAVEKEIGSKEFLIFYFVTGIITGLLSLLVYYLTGQYMVFLMGASGAIYALLLAFAVLHPTSSLSIWGLIPVKAPILVLIYGAIEFFSGFFSNSNIGHFAHFFGLLVSFLYFIIRFGVNPLRVWKDALKK